MPDTSAPFALPRRTERVTFEGAYSGLWADVVVNPSGRVLALGQAPTPRYGFWAAIIADWNLAGPDGTVLPITVAALPDVPADILERLEDEWSRHQELDTRTRRQLVNLFQGRGSTTPRAWLLVKIAEKWNMAPPVLEFLVEEGGWSQWWHRALAMYSLEADVAGATRQRTAPTEEE